MKETIIKVEGMACIGCENRIQNALKGIEGINEVKANHNTGIVEITSNGEIPEKIIKETIEDIGFKIIDN